MDRRSVSPLQRLPIGGRFCGESEINLRYPLPKPLPSGEGLISSRHHVLPLLFRDEAEEGFDVFPIVQADDVGVVAKVVGEGIGDAVTHAHR